MKRFSKILVAVLALCLLVGVLALAISADESGVEGKFVVRGVGYDEWDEAVAAAANTHTIYLNEDWTLDTGLVLSGETTNVKLNLNGKTVTVTDGTMLFNVHTSAKLTIEGSGTFNNSGLVLIGGSSSGVVTVNATGAGIVINNNATSGDVNTFRFTSRSTLNVSGKIVVNTNAVTTSRTIFNVADSSKKTVTLNIKDADVLYATPSVTGAPAGKVIYSQFSDVNVDNSRLEGVYCYVIYSATTGSVNLSGYIVDRDESDAVNYGWDSTKLAEIKAIEIPITETYTVNNSVIYSAQATGYTGNISGSMMYFGGATKADFTNCEIYGHYRAIYGKQANDSWSAAKIPTKTTDASQLTFNDCHFRACAGGSIQYLFCYGPNFRVFGGSISGGTLANCQPHYVELDNGQWLGGYVDNVLGVSGLNNDTVVTTSWQNTTNYNPAATITGTLPQSVTIVVGGKSETFTKGYFSDMAKYNSYLPPVAEKQVWEDYIVQMSNANVVGGSFLKDGANAAVGTNPLGTAYTFGTTNGTTSYVYDSKGNGYVKHYMAGGSGGQPTTSNYQQIVTGSASFATTDAYVWEWDVSTDDAQYVKVSFTAQGRELKPRFNADGTYIGDAARAYLNQPGGIDITAANTFTFNGGSAKLATTKGEWSRITIVVDIVRGELTEIDVPAYSDVNTPIDGVTVKKNAYSILGSKVYAYVDGVLVGSKDFGSTDWGYNGYIIEGYEAKYYFDQIRISPYAANANGSYCVDNVRTSVYPIGSGVDLGLYNQDGSVKTDINGLPHFLVMPNNNTTVFVETYVANVDGVNYKTESEALAAIKEGSTVELFANLESYVPANVEFKLITNGYTVPGFISATHKVVDYSGMGMYKLVEASADEIFTINYSFGGKTVTQTVAMGTVVPEITETFPTTVDGTTVTFVESWTLPENINDYALSTNVINATAVTETKEAVAMAGGVAYETIEAAIADANGATITLLSDVTVNEMIYVDSVNATIDLNGKTITVGDAADTLFNVRKGSNFTLKGTGTINNALTVIGSSNLGVEGTTVNVNADAANGSTGIVINHRTIEEGADTSTAISTFRIHDSSTLNVSGLITVNAYNGMRVVFNVYAGDGTVAAKALNISRAKVVVPLLGRTPDNTTPKGYSQVISAGDGTAININDSELYALYGQLFHINGASSNKNVSSYMNADFTWLDSAASSIKIDAATVTINAKNSRFFSEFGSYSQPMHASGHNPGASFMSLAARLDATFEDCTITTDWRGVTDNAGISGKKINNNQLLFLNCDFVTAPKTGETANAAPQFFMYGCNYKIIGGTWAHGSMSAGSNYYLELTDASGNPTGQWVGGYMDGVLVDTAKTHKYSGVSGNWEDSTYVERDAITCNITRVTDGVARTFKAAYFGNLSEYLNTVKAYEALSYFYNTGDEATPFPNFGVGAVNGTVTKTGGYVKHYFEAAAGINAYNNLDGNPADVSFETTGAYVWEFDVSTDDGYFAYTSIGVEARDRHAVFAADGSYLGYANSAGALNSVNYEATWSLDISGDTAKFNGKTVTLSTEKGDWTRITIIYDVVLGEERTETVPTYEKSSEDSTKVVEVEGVTKDIQVIDITGTTMSVYVDGVLLSSYNPITTSDFFGGAIAKDYLANGYIDDLRIKNKATQESSVCYDNVVFMPISHDFSSELLGIVGNDGKPAASIVGSMIYGSLAENETPVINVDGVDYTSVAEANAAIKENSIVELLANIDEAIEINYAGIKLVNTGYTFKGFVSSAYTFADYTAARNAKYSAPAAANEIFTIEYPEYNGVSGTQTAVLGSLLKAPAEFDAVSKLLNEGAKQYQTLVGWTLVDGEDVQVVSANGVAYPVVDTVGAVVVYWKDANSNVLDTDFYFPGDSTVLNDFDGEDIAVDYTQNAYYGVGRTGWAGIEEATAGLATSGEYTITAVMGKVAPKMFPGLKYNIAIYTSYVMNFYVPMDNEGVSNITVATDVDGSISISKFEDGTLGGVDVYKFGYLLGLNATELQTFYLVYNVGEDKIAFPIYVSAPTYLAQVMAIYDEDTSAKGEATKTLMVNFANYATKVFALTGDVDMTTGGAKIYADIVAAYGEDYLGYYTNDASNDKFLAGGKLYEDHKVADLNYVKGTDENEGNATALSYIESISFNFNSYEPAFIIKLSDAAVTKGLQEPSSSGSTGYYGAGLHVYSGYAGVLASKTWAEKDGKQYFGGADLWASYDGDTVISAGDTSYDYYSMATNTAWNTLGANAGRQNWFKVENIRGNFTVRVYWNVNDENVSSSVTVVGDVNYNLAAYINSMLVDEEGNDTSVENAQYIEAARALYALSCASANYKGTK